MKTNTGNKTPIIEGIPAGPFVLTATRQDTSPKYRRDRHSAFVLSALLLVLATLGNGCSGTESQSPAETLSARRILSFIAPQEAHDLIEENSDNPDFVIIDDRVPEQFSEGRIASAVNIAYGPDFDARLGSLDKNKLYLVYCNSGCGASSGAMSQLGFREVYEIEGGVDAWKSQGLPVA